MRAHAEWFAWAKRQKADFGRAHGAARQAVAAFEAGMRPPELENAAREALKTGDTTPVDETRQAYSAWYAVAAVDMGMPRERAHAFAQAGYAAQRDGADLKAATGIAEAAVAGLAGPPPPPPPAFTTAPIPPSSSFPPPQPPHPPTPVELGDWGPPPGAPAAPPPPLPPPPPPPPPSTPPVAEGWKPPPPAPPPPSGPPAWKPPPAAVPGEAVTQTAPPAPAAPLPPQATRQGAIDRAIADSKLSAVTRSQAKLVPYAEVKKAANRVFLSDTLPGEIPVWVVAVAGTVTALAEPAVGHAVAYLARDQHASLAFDLHTGTGWPAWFDALPDQAAD